MRRCRDVATPKRPLLWRMSATQSSLQSQKTIREDRLEETIQTLLNDLVCPSQELIDWVAQQLETRRETTSQAHEDTLESINRQIDRLVRMGSDLYDDKLVGDITKTFTRQSTRRSWSS